MTQKSLSELEKLADVDCELCDGKGYTTFSFGPDDSHEEPCVCIMEEKEENDISGAEGDPNDR